MGNNQIENNDNNIILYQNENISQHIESIFRDGELKKAVTNKKFLLVRTEGTRQVIRAVADDYEGLGGSIE